MIPNPIRRSASPMPQHQQQQQPQQQQQQPQFIYATSTPNAYTPQMATNNGGMAVPPSAGGPEGKPLYLCQPFVRAALVTGKFKSIVVLPKYVDVNEWVALNMFDFFTNLNLFLGVLSDCCTQSSCPTMAAGPGVDYTWVDNNRRQLRLAAPTYIDFVSTWVQNSLDDPAMFPTKFAQEFAPHFPTMIKQMYRQLLRIFAHVFFAHYPVLLHLHSEGHFNSLFAHFLAFGKEFEILDPRDLRGIGVGELADRWKEMGILES